MGRPYGSPMFDPHEVVMRQGLTTGWVAALACEVVL
jgi:hypothetical protein